MNYKKLVSAEEVLAQQLKSPAFRAEWERTSLARAVALEVVRYRADHGLSQAVFARQLGVSQPVIARLEQGDHMPTWETLSRLARSMDVHFVVDIAPSEGARLREVS
jgi:ribosome-binding protein aMBF1 (putative translation factor)